MNSLATVDFSQPLALLPSLETRGWGCKFHALVFLETRPRPKAMQGPPASSQLNAQKTLITLDIPRVLGAKNWEQRTNLLISSRITSSVLSADSI